MIPFSIEILIKHRQLQGKTFGNIIISDSVCIGLCLSQILGVSTLCDACGKFYTAVTLCFRGFQFQTLMHKNYVTGILIVVVFW